MGCCFGKGGAADEVELVGGTPSAPAHVAHAFDCALCDPCLAIDGPCAHARSGAGEAGDGFCTEFPSAGDICAVEAVFDPPLCGSELGFMRAELAGSVQWACDTDDAVTLRFAARRGQARGELVQAQLNAATLDVGRWRAGDRVGLALHPPAAGAGPAVSVYRNGAEVAGGVPAAVSGGACRAYVRVPHGGSAALQAAPSFLPLHMLQGAEEP